jgi:hypothetical protein
MFEELKQNSTIGGDRPRFTNSRKVVQKDEEGVTPTEVQFESPPVYMPEEPHRTVIDTSK